MNRAHIQGRLRSRVFGGALALCVASSHAVATAEPAVRTQNAGGSKGKVVHYIENQADVKGTKPVTEQSGVQKLDANKAKPLTEQPPLELKGVRG